MRSHPCVVVRLADDVAQKLRDGDSLTLALASGSDGTVVCLHRGLRIGQIPAGRNWIARSLADGERHEVLVTGFDTDSSGKLAQIEIAVAILGDERPDRPAIRSVISEIGDELRVLAMVGAADGRLEPAERSVIEQYAAARTADLGLTPDEGEVAHAVRWARRHMPDVLDAATIVKKLKKARPEALPIVWEACCIVAEADGRIDIGERESMSTLRALLEEGMSAAKRRS